MPAAGFYCYLWCNISYLDLATSYRLILHKLEEYHVPEKICSLRVLLRTSASAWHCLKKEIMTDVMCRGAVQRPPAPKKSGTQQWAFRMSKKVAEQFHYSLGETYTEKGVTEKPVRVWVDSSPATWTSALSFPQVTGPYLVRGYMWTWNSAPAPLASADLWSSTMESSQSKMNHFVLPWSLSSVALCG